MERSPKSGGTPGSRGLITGKIPSTASTNSQKQGSVARESGTTGPPNERQGHRVARTPNKLREISRWLRERTSPYDFGYKTADGPRHGNLNRSVLGLFSRLRLDMPRTNLARMNNQDFLDHFQGRETFYFTADGRSGCKEVLVNLDIDCHGKGSLAGAVAFAEHLREEYFPGLYFEVSTNGHGVHGYLVIRKGDLGDERLNMALKGLDRCLKHLMARGGWDIENVEVKGQAPEFVWGIEKYELRGYKSGQLAKFPREALSRGDELRNTTRFTYDELLRLIQTKIRIVRTPQPEQPPGKAAGLTKIAPRETTGSISGLSIPEELAGQIQGHLLRVARNLFPAGMTTGRGRAVTPEDMAALLAVLKFCGENPNPDGSTPTNRVKALWDGLYRRGFTERGWDHHRYKALRDWLSKNGYLAWDDDEYVVGQNVNGVFRKGRAARWAAGEHLLAMLEEENAEVEHVEAGDEERVLGFPSFKEGRRETSLWAVPDPHVVNPTPLKLRLHWKVPLFGGFVGKPLRLAA